MLSVAIRRIQKQALFKLYFQSLTSLINRLVFKSDQTMATVTSVL